MQLSNGSVLYNGTPLTDFLPERTAVYVEQEDQHLPELTVRETFDFAARCQGVGVQAGKHTADVMHADVTLLRPLVPLVSLYPFPGEHGVST